MARSLKELLSLKRPSPPPGADPKLQRSAIAEEAADAMPAHSAVDAQAEALGGPAAAALVRRNEALWGAFGGEGAPGAGATDDEALTPLQLRAIGLLMVGRSCACVARALGVSRATVFRWRRQEAFAAALRARQALLFEQAVDGLRVLMLQAVGEIRRDLKSRNWEIRKQAAYRLLPYIGSPRLLPVAAPESCRGESRSVSSPSRKTTATAREDAGPPAKGSD